MTSKQPWRTDLTLDLKSVTSTTYISMCILLICFGLKELKGTSGPILKGKRDNRNTVNVLVKVDLGRRLGRHSPVLQLRPPSCSLSISAFSLRATNVVNASKDLIAGNLLASRSHSKYFD